MLFCLRMHFCITRKIFYEGLLCFWRFCLSQKNFVCSLVFDSYLGCCPCLNLSFSFCVHVPVRESLCVLSLSLPTPWVLLSVQDVSSLSSQQVTVTFILKTLHLLSYYHNKRPRVHTSHKLNLNNKKSRYANCPIEGHSGDLEFLRTRE